jgi:hypothetical protein
MVQAENPMSGGLVPPITMISLEFSESVPFTACFPCSVGKLC